MSGGSLLSFGKQAWVGAEVSWAPLTPWAASPRVCWGLVESRMWENLAVVQQKGDKWVLLSLSRVLFIPNAGAFSFQPG